MAARFAEPTKVEIEAFLEKATQENTKRQFNMELWFLTVSLQNEEIFQVIINLKQSLKYSYKTPVAVLVQKLVAIWLALKIII